MIKYSCTDSVSSPLAPTQTWGLYYVHSLGCKGPGRCNMIEMKYIARVTCRRISGMQRRRRRRRRAGRNETRRCPLAFGKKWRRGDERGPLVYEVLHVSVCQFCFFIFLVSDKNI